MNDDRELVGRRRERQLLNALVDAVRAGESRVLVLRGGPGIGKTALLDHIRARAVGCRVESVAGIQAEMELPFAGLHQLVAPMLDGAARLPAPQLDALQTAFGISSGPTPDRFLVGLAVLSLLSEVAETEPLCCFVDDVHWLDRVSVQVLTFVGRRLQAESVGLVFASRAPSVELAGLPELAVEGLTKRDANALLDSILTGPLDARIRERVLAEAGGNPLALLELFRGARPADVAGGFGLPAAVPVATSIEEEFRARLDALPADTRRLLQVAAADPVGDPALVWRAAEGLGLGASAAVPAVEAGLLDIATTVQFRHPLVRSAAYRSASVEERLAVHEALADATDPDLDPDRRAWHRAQAAPGPDEDVARELERSADRAQSRGGLAGAAAFLQRAARLTPEPRRRAERALAAARGMRDAGGHQAALDLLVTVESGPFDAVRSVEVERLRGEIALDQRRYGEAARRLLSAARQLGERDPALARETYLVALGAAQYTDESDWSGAAWEVAAAARNAPAAPGPVRPADAALDAFATLMTDGYETAAPLLRRCVELALAPEAATDAAGSWLWRPTGWASLIIAIEAWDDDAWFALTTRWVQLARDAGAAPHLLRALDFLAWSLLWLGSPAGAQEAYDEMLLVSDAIGQPLPGSSELAFAVWRGEEESASAFIEATLRERTELGSARLASSAASLGARLYNSLGRHGRARDLALRAFESDELAFGPFLIPELAEAASRTGDSPLLERTLAWVAERARFTPTEWCLGIEARVSALLESGEAINKLHRESIEHLGRTRVRIEVARGHLVYGEWLREENRRSDAREQLKTAHELFTSLGASFLADRAARALLATGGTVRTPSVDSATDLTAQEAQVACLARDGLSNPEIGARLFISARTVQYHLRKVFQKLDITSRGELHRVLAND